jgi:hypothetical protein
VNVCARGGGGSGSTACRPPPKSEKRPEDSQAVSATAKTEAITSLSDNPVFIDDFFPHPLHVWPRVHLILSSPAAFKQAEPVLAKASMHFHYTYPI